MSKKSSSDILDPRQLAARLGCSREWVYLLARRGHLPHFRDGRRLRFHFDEAKRAFRRRPDPHPSLGRPRPDLTAKAALRRAESQTLEGSQQ